jgi:hypothetical protein
LLPLDGARQCWANGGGQQGQSSERLHGCDTYERKPN